MSTYRCLRDCFFAERYFVKGAIIDENSLKSLCRPGEKIPRHFKNLSPAQVEELNTPPSVKAKTVSIAPKPRDFVEVMRSMPREEDDDEDLIPPKPDFNASTDSNKGATKGK